MKVTTPMADVSRLGYRPNGSVDLSLLDAKECVRGECEDNKDASSSSVTRGSYPARVGERGEWGGMGAEVYSSGSEGRETKCL